MRAILLAVARGRPPVWWATPLTCRFGRRWGLDITPYSIYCRPSPRGTAEAVYHRLAARRNKVGVVVDAATYGFAVGTGFAFVENLRSADTPETDDLDLDCSRIRHALIAPGTTAIRAMIARTLDTRAPTFRPALMLPARQSLGCCTLVLGSWSHRCSPLRSSCGVPLHRDVSFPEERAGDRSGSAGFDTDQELLALMRAGEVADTPVGLYLKGLRTSFPPEVIVE